MEDGRAEGSSAIGDGGQAAVSFTVDVAGADSVSLLDSSLKPILNKKQRERFVKTMISPSCVMYSQILGIMDGHLSHLLF